MYEVMRVRLAKVLSKCVFIILLFHLSQSFLFSITLSPAMAAGGKMNYFALVFSSVSTAFVFFLSFLFLYGIISYFTKVILARKDVMRVFTSGLRDKTKRAHFVAAAFSCLFILAAVVAFTVVLKFRDEIYLVASTYYDQDETPEETVRLIKAFSLAIVFCIIFFVSALVVSIPFLFSWNILFEDKKISAARAMAKSFSLMSRNCFHFVGFVIYCCFKNVVFIALLFVINMYLSKSESFISNFVSMLVGFFAFVQEYTIIVKAYCSIPVYYYSLLSVNGMVERKDNESSSK